MEKSISKPVSIYALGGLGEVGKNMYCFENESQIVIIDCGVKFPGVELPGIDYIVPDFTHLKNNKNKILILLCTKYTYNAYNCFFFIHYENLFVYL